MNGALDLGTIVTVLQFTTPFLVALLAFALHSIRQTLLDLGTKVDRTHEKLIENYVKKEDHDQDVRDLWKGMTDVHTKHNELAIKVERIRPEGQ